MEAGPLSTTRRIPWIPLVLLGVMVWLAVRHAPEAFRAVDLVRLVDPAWLALALVLQAATYLCVGVAYCTLAGALGIPLRLRDGYRMSVVNLFVNAAFPSAGLSGNLFLVRMMDRSGVPPGTGAIIVLGERAAYFAMLLLLVSALGGRESLRLGGTGGLAALPLILALAVGLALGVRAVLRRPLAAARVLERAIGKLPARLRARAIAPERIVEDARRIEAGGGATAISPARIAVVLVAEAGLLACDALTVWALLCALGVDVTPLKPAVAFGISTLVGQVLLVPGALEVSLGGILIAQRIRPAAALGATAIFHALSLWAPMPLGGWFYGRSERRGVTRRPSDATSSTSRTRRTSPGEGPSP